MLIFRHFRNTDPPALVRVWNEAMTGRGAVHLAGAAPLEQQVFSKLYFDPAGFLLAEDEGQLVGFAHAGFGPDAQEQHISWQTGVICLLAVIPTRRRQGIGSELLRRCEAYLSLRGAQQIFAGPNYPQNPFYRGLYGGCDLPGFLLSDELAEPFLLRRGYQPCRETLVLHRPVQQSLRIFDPRFVAFRQRFDIQADLARSRPTWWQNCTLGVLEPLEFSVLEKTTGTRVADALLMEMEGFSHRWNQPTAGIFALRVDEVHRRQGIGKFMLAQMLRFVQEQCFELVEIQAPGDNQGAVQLCRGLGFEQVDLGRVYKRNDE